MQGSRFRRRPSKYLRRTGCVFSWWDLSQVIRRSSTTSEKVCASTRRVPSSKLPRSWASWYTGPLCSDYPVRVHKQSKKPSDLLVRLTLIACRFLSPHRIRVQSFTSRQKKKDGWSKKEIGSYERGFRIPFFRTGIYHLKKCSALWIVFTGPSTCAPDLC